MNPRRRYRRLLAALVATVALGLLASLSVSLLGQERPRTWKIERAQAVGTSPVAWDSASIHPPGARLAQEGGAIYLWLILWKDDLPWRCASLDPYGRRTGWIQVELRPLTVITRGPNPVFLDDPHCNTAWKLTDPEGRTRWLVGHTLILRSEETGETVVGT